MALKTGNTESHLPSHLPPRTATDSGLVEHWQFYDGEAQVLER